MKKIGIISDTLNTLNLATRFGIVATFAQQRLPNVLPLFVLCVPCVAMATVATFA